VAQPRTRLTGYTGYGLSYVLFKVSHDSQVGCVRYARGR